MKFRLIDRIYDYQPLISIRGSKTVSFEEYSLARALAAEPALPETLLLEGIFQLGNWLIMLSTDFTQMGMIARTNSIQFLDRVRPGQRMDVKLTVRSWRKDGILFDGEASVGNNVVTRGNGCLATPVDLSSFYDGNDMRTLFDEIHRPQGEINDGPA